MKHLKSTIAFACLVALVCVLPQGALAQANPRFGTWKLNVAKSTYQQGKAPGSETRTYLATDDGGLQLTANAVLTGGEKQPSGYRAKYDGKDYPYSGTAGDTIAMTGDGWASDSTIKMGGKVTQTSHSVVSKNGKRMTSSTSALAWRSLVLDNPCILKEAAYEADGCGVSEHRRYGDCLPQCGDASCTAQLFGC